ncbi:hypothetical protein [Corallococcus terminator]|uniref:Uncharacterized protein n=1 Tax=Corallococcus terminator TaxID=2316733 RepID=A0A3A8J663_9BACT|nr:hypothetical protein [Corallococcus terminator]RKG90508.1 hypothetical protein D7V88_10920 [Corallococcus terminator]
MTKIKSPTGFVSTPKTAPKSATTEGKPAGAPELKKAPKAPGDSFEQTKTAPKSGKEGLKINDRIIMKVIADEPTTPAKGENTGLKVNDRIIMKVIADEPTTPVTGGGTPGLIDDHIVKIVADEPTNPVTGGGDIGFKGNIGGKGDFKDDIGFKGNIGGKGDFKDIGFPHGPIKVIADEPTTPVKGDGDSGLKIDDHIVKVIADEPTNPISGGNGGSIKDIDDGVIVKIISDDPIRGPSEPSFKPPKLDIKPLDTHVLKVRMDSPV